MTRNGLPIIPHRGVSDAASTASKLRSSSIQYWFRGVIKTAGERPAQEAL
jgi:hypothetical protein